MNLKPIPNRAGPDCELTIKIRFSSIERFREDYYNQITDKYFFLKTPRSKPVGTRVQLIFLIKRENEEPLEVWSWGVIEKIITPEEALEQQTVAGLQIKLMDLTARRRKQIEQLFGVDEAVEAVLGLHAKEEVPQKTTHQSRLPNPQKELLARVDALLQALDSDYYELLGVPKNASAEEIRRAYRQRSKEYHPDQYFRKLPQEMLQKLQKAFQKMTEAYRTLTHPEKRLKYDISINNYTNPDAMREAMPHVRRQKQFIKAYKQTIAPRQERIQELIQAANDDMKEENYSGAKNKLKIAQALDPLNPQIRKKLAKIEKLLNG